MGFCFVNYMFLSNNPSSGDINSSNLSCLTILVDEGREDPNTTKG